MFVYIYICMFMSVIASSPQGCFEGKRRSSHLLNLCRLKVFLIDQIDLVVVISSKEVHISKSGINVHLSYRSYSGGRSNKYVTAWRRQEAKTRSNLLVSGSRSVKAGQLARIVGRAIKESRRRRSLRKRWVRSGVSTPAPPAEEFNASRNCLAVWPLSWLKRTDWKEGRVESNEVASLVALSGSSWPC